jgi:HAMP domain-containing protein
VRRRITFAIVGAVIAALVIAGAGTFVLDRLSARETTRRELERQSQSLIAILDETILFRTTAPATVAARQAEIRQVINRIKGLSNLTEEDIGILVGTSLDKLDGTTPRNITLDADDLARLKTPNTVVSGNRGRVVYAAAVGDQRALKYVVVVARPPESDARPALGWFLVASAGTIALGFVIALWLSRGLTNRLRAAQATTHSIASGDLSARVPEPGTNDQDEVADLSRSINSMAVQLERARGLERQFLMSITHDLRTPLTYRTEEGRGDDPRAVTTVEPTGHRSPRSSATRRAFVLARRGFRGRRGRRRGHGSGVRTQGGRPQHRADLPGHRLPADLRVDGRNAPRSSGRQSHRQRAEVRTDAHRCVGVRARRLGGDQRCGRRQRHCTR